MTFLALIGLFALLAAFWMALPFLSGGVVEMNEADSALSVYRDQMDEIDRDQAQGLISADERDAATSEIQARALKAARRLNGGITVSRRSIPAAVSVVVIGAGLAAGSYLHFGEPGFRDQPLAQRKTELLELRAAAGDIDSRIALLIERTSKNPDSFEDWWTLGVSYATIGDHASSVDAYRRAVELGGDRPGVLSSYAEAMTLANGNKVPQAARVIFEQVLRSGPDARARYYVALAKAQAQDFEGALADWTALANDSQPDAPWMPLVRRDIVNMARFLNVDLRTILPDATLAEIAKADGNTGEAAELRAAELETQLARDPLDFAKWIELAEILASQDNKEGAASALDSARRHYAAAPFVLQKINESARSLGLDNLRHSADARGPTASDMAAAAEMTQSERDDMIAGMVDGLAARLQEDPDSLDSWLMLIRSYDVLGERQKARDAFATATAHFKDDPSASATLRLEAGHLAAD